MANFLSFVKDIWHLRRWWLYQEVVRYPMGFIQHFKENHIWNVKQSSALVYCWIIYDFINIYTLCDLCTEGEFDFNFNSLK